MSNLKVAVPPAPKGEFKSAKIKLSWNQESAYHVVKDKQDTATIPDAPSGVDYVLTMVYEDAAGKITRGERQVFFHNKPNARGPFTPVDGASK